MKYINRKTMQVIFILGFSVIIAAAEKPESELSDKKQQEDLAKKNANALRVLGSTVGERIDTGFVFFKNIYIEAPYVVTRKGIQILINNKEVYQWKVWPLPKYSFQDPGPLPLTRFKKTSTFKDMGAEVNGEPSHYTLKFRYLMEKYKCNEEFHRKMEEYIRQYPCIKKVTFKDNLLKMETHGGEKRELMVFYHQDGIYSGKFKNEDLIKILDAKKDEIEKKLKQNESCFFYPNGLTFYIKSQDIARDLKVVIEILQSDMKPEEKYDLLERLDLVSASSKKAYLPYLNKIKIFDQFSKRLNKIIATEGIEPRKIEEIPLKSKWTLRKESVERNLKEKKEREQKAKMEN